MSKIYFTIAGTNHYHDSAFFEKRDARRTHEGTKQSI